MSATAIRRLRDVRMADVHEVGGKAGSLGELLAAGARVPDGVVLTPAVAGIPAAERRSMVQTTVQALGGGPFAVRSSGVAEDSVERSHAGIFETVLEVPVEGIEAAIERVLASARSARATEYEPGRHGRMAVIIQRMVRPAAAGVALTADPISGDRQTCVVTAVRGNGERLVSGAALGDEWLIRDSAVTARRRPEQAIDRSQATQVAAEARRIAAARGIPQDIEWAIDADGVLWIVQARPMTALPPEVSWTPPAPGAYTRAFRFGEWIPEPVTPLFESWLLTALEDRLHALLEQLLGERDPRPYHVVVNGWYYYSLNWLSPSVLLRNLPRTLWHLIRSPRAVAGLFPPTVRYSVPPLEREWRDDLLPRYRAGVASAESQVESLPVSELPALIDGLAELAGEYFTSIAALAGGAFKVEIMLARFYRRHLAGPLGGSHLPLVAGLQPPADPGRHAVVSLDWWHAPAPLAETAARPAEQHAQVIAIRQVAEERAFRTLAATPRRLRAFRRLLADAQHLAAIREEQVPDLTIAWPVMRRAVLRVGASLAASGVVQEPDDVFFLTRGEALEGVAQERLAAPVDVHARRSARDEQAKLMAPLIVGRLNRMQQSMVERLPRLAGAVPSDSALVSGTPASPGRATGAVRVIRGPHEFGELQAGEILVAPLTAPAWTPLFTRAAGVVTDVGSLASHASIIAREYGIPAIVGCGDATARLRTGMLVAVDGSTGNVEPAQPA